MDEINHERRFWTRNNHLGYYLENKCGLRLSGAEKMLVRQELESVNYLDSLSIIRVTLEKFEFDSESFRNWQKIIKRSYQRAIKEYEFRGRQK